MEMQGYKGCSVKALKQSEREGLELDEGKGA